MNWIIRKMDKLSAHTYLNELLAPILNDLEDFSWLLADLEFNSSEVNDQLPINMDQDYILLSRDQFANLLDADIQIWWGVILGIPPFIDVVIDEDNLPYAKGNAAIWKNDNIQHPNAEIEIICYDSGYTIVKFKNEYLSNKFKNHFTEAIDLEKFRSKMLPRY